MRGRNVGWEIDKEREGGQERVRDGDVGRHGGKKIERDKWEDRELGREVSTRS